MGVRGYHYKEHVHMLKGANNTKWMMDGPRCLSRQKTVSRAGGQADESDFPRETDSLSRKTGKTERLKYMMDIYFLGGFGLWA